MRGLWVVSWGLQYLEGDEACIQACDELKELCKICIDILE